jgi:hypothetical protein
MSEGEGDGGGKSIGGASVIGGISRNDGVGVEVVDDVDDELISRPTSKNNFNQL